MSQTGGGAMAAVVGLSEQIVEETRKRHGATDVVIANHNAPEQFVLSGSRGELARLRPVFEKTEGVRGFVPVRVSGPFHAPPMARAAERFRSVRDSVDVGELRTPVVSNVTGRPFGADAQEVRALLAEQIAWPVRWSDSIRYLRDAGVSVFTELGESKVLTSLIDRITTTREAAPDPRRHLIERIHQARDPPAGDR
ncbi:hypothetical protein OH791_01800 [Streptomyces anulatus]|nr:hypothetical protein OH791_01800 [Streptomyces anulatus]